MSSTSIKDRLSEYYPTENPLKIGKEVFWGVVGGSLLSRTDNVFEKITPLFKLNSTSQQSIINSLKSAITPRKSFIGSLFVIGVMPICEEVFFRGKIRDLQLEHRGKTTYSEALKSSLINALLFSCAHIELKKGLNNVKWCGPAFLTGIVCYGMTDLSNTLWGATAAHSSANACTLYKLKRGKF